MTVACDFQIGSFQIYQLAFQLERSIYTIYLFIYQSSIYCQYGLLFYSMGYNMLWTLFILMLKLSLTCPVGMPQLALCVLLTCQFFFLTFSVFLAVPYFLAQNVQVHLVPSLHQPWNLSFLQGYLIPFNREWYLGIKIWVLGMLIAPGV